MKALAITLAAGRALGRLRAAAATPAAKLAAAASDLAPLAKARAGAAVGIVAGGGPLTYRSRAYYGSGPACTATGPGWLGYGPAWYADGYGAGLYGRWW